jgi:hypothetical protein
MSAIAAFRRCPKMYQLGYELGLQPIKTKDVVERGSDFHAQIAALTLTGEAPSGEMGDVVRAYVAHKPLPSRIISAEKPLFTKVLRGVYLRTTFDLLYQDGAAIVARDYKTFATSPTVEMDLDFQGRVYTAAIMRTYHTFQTWRFEYEYVRQERFHKKGGQPNLADPWSPEESYYTYPLSISQNEADRVWAELEETVRDILRKRKRAAKYPATWTRTDLKGTINSCRGCFYSDLCRSEFTHGALYDIDLELYAKPERRERDVILPKGIR